MVQLTGIFSFILLVIITTVTASCPEQCKLDTSRSPYSLACPPGIPNESKILQDCVKELGTGRGLKMNGLFGRSRQKRELSAADKELAQTYQLPDLYKSYVNSMVDLDELRKSRNEIFIVINDTVRTTLKNIDLKDTTLTKILPDSFISPKIALDVTESLTFDDLSDEDKVFYSAVLGLRSVFFDENKISYLAEHAFQNLETLSKAKPTKPTYTSGSISIDTVVSPDTDGTCDCGWIELGRNEVAQGVKIVNLLALPTCSDNDALRYCKKYALMTPVNSSTPAKVPPSGKLVDLDLNLGDEAQGHYDPNEVHQRLDIVNLLRTGELPETTESEGSGFLTSENVWILLGLLLVVCFILLCSVVFLYKKYRSVRNVIKQFRRQIHREEALIIVRAPSNGAGSSPSDTSSTKGGIGSVDDKGTIFYLGDVGSRKSADSDVSSSAFSISSGRGGTVFYQARDNEHYKRQYDRGISECVASGEEKSSDGRSSADEVNTTNSNRGEYEGTYDRRVSEWAARSDVGIDRQDSDEGGGAIFYQPGSDERMSEGATSISIDEQQSGTIFFGTESDEIETAGSDRNVSEGVTTRIYENSGRRNTVERKRRSLVHGPESDDEISRGEGSPELPATRTKQNSDAVVHKQTVLPDDVELSSPCSPRTDAGRGPLFFRPASDANITHSRRNSEWESRFVGSHSQERESVSLNDIDDTKGNFVTEPNIRRSKRQTLHDSSEDGISKQDMIERIPPNGSEDTAHNRSSSRERSRSPSQSRHESEMWSQSPRVREDDDSGSGHSSMHEGGDADQGGPAEESGAGENGAIAESRTSQPTTEATEDAVEPRRRKKKGTFLTPKGLPNKKEERRKYGEPAAGNSLRTVSTNIL